MALDYSVRIGASRRRWTRFNTDQLLLDHFYRIGAKFRPSNDSRAHFHRGFQRVCPDLVEPVGQTTHPLVGILPR